MPTNETIEKEKVIMGYKIKFKTSYDEADAEGRYIILNIQISDELKDMLKKATINKITNVSISRDDNTPDTIGIKRYKIKTLINNQLGSNTRDIMFAKDLIDDGEISLKFRSVNMVIHIIDNLKSSFRTLIETIVGCLNISQEVTFNIM